MEPKYPHVTVKLTGTDDNVFAILGRVRKALREAGEPEAAATYSDAVLDCSSYNEVLRLTMSTVTVE